MSYEAFGKRRGGDWRAATDTSYTLPSFTNRGYTGHEHVDEMGLIHMNGRVYDPELGRFLSADPNVQAAENSQSYNRYSYVLNNPLKYTDPSGYFWKKLKKFVKKYWKPIVAIGLAIVTGGATLAYLGTLGVTGFWAAVGAGAASGFVSGGVMTGTLRGALTGAAIGAVSAGAAWGIGHAGGAMMNSARNFAGGLGRHIMHGIAQGGLSSARGGTFRAGFWSGSLGSAVPVGQDASFTAKAIAGAVVGGTASRLGGGKFANGAMSGAFVQMFNHGMSAVKNNYSVRKQEVLETNMVPVGKEYPGRATFAGKLRGLMTDTLGVLKPSFSMEKVRTYYKRIDTIRIDTYTYDGTTHQLIGVEIGESTQQVWNVNGGNESGYTAVKGGLYFRDGWETNGIGDAEWMIR